MRDRHTPHREFVLWIAANGYAADLVAEHVRSVPTDECASCEQLWPCNMRRVAEHALQLDQADRL